MKHSKSGIFLMELIISILFFALSSAVCIQLFVKAHLLGEETAEQNKSILWCQNLAELYIECDGSTEEIYDYLLAGSTLSKDNITLRPKEAASGDIILYFDQNFLPSTQNSPNLAYAAVLSCTENSGSLLTAEASVHRAEPGFDSEAFLSSSASPYPVVYSLHLQHHIAMTLGETEAASYE